MFNRKRYSGLPSLGVLAALVIAAGCGGSSSSAETGTSAIPASLNAATPLLNSSAAAVPGLSTSQQVIGLGSIFGLAKQKMPSDQYALIAAAIPGSDALAVEASNKGLPNNLGGMSDVTKFTGKSGVKPEHLSHMMPVIGDHLAGRVSPTTANASSFASLTMSDVGDRMWKTAN